MAQPSQSTQAHSALFRMRDLPLSELPVLPTESTNTAAQTPTEPTPSSSPSLEIFITRALTDAHTFISTYLPQHFKPTRKAQVSQPSTAKVDLLTHELKPQDLPPPAKAQSSGRENWFSRTSIHENASKPGTASWEEFDSGLRVDHSQHEKEYTPGVVDAHEVVSWDAELAELENKVGEWEDVHMSIMEMRHHIPSPMNDRVFPVVLITAKRGAMGEFIVVQIPVGTEGLTRAKYGKSASGVTVGRYVSVEWCRLVDGGKNVKWQMATASDARGNLPMVLQKMGVPGAVIKDVGLFIGWCQKNRIEASS